MDKNIIVWSCNRRKFMNVLASTNEYSERLGCKANSVWYVQIRLFKNIDRSHGYMDYETYDSVWEFNLIRRQGFGSTNVTAKLISNTKVLIGRELYFNDGGASTIGECDTSKLNNYKLDLVLTFPQSAEPKTDHEEKTSISKVTDLADDFLSMLEKAHLADVTLKCDSVVLKAHKNILSARSPVFESMFACPMEESVNDTVVIKDMNSSIFHAMVSFMYCGQVTVTSVSLACELLYAAEKYQLKALKKGCVDYLKSVMSCENAFKILETADLYDKQLKMNAVNYINDSFNDLEATEEWQVLKSKKPALALEVYASRD